MCAGDALVRRSPAGEERRRRSRRRGRDGRVRDAIAKRQREARHDDAAKGGRASEIGGVAREGKTRAKAERER